MVLTDEQLDSIEQKAKEASPGNWHTVDRIWLPRDGMTYVIAGHHDPHVGAFVCDVGEVDEWDDDNTYEKQAAQKEADAKFIAAADPIRVEALIHEVRRWRRAFKNRGKCARPGCENGVAESPPWCSVACMDEHTKADAPTT